MGQTEEWLRGLAALGGKGVVNNIDARCLGRIADDLDRLRAELAGKDALIADLHAVISSLRRNVLLHCCGEG